MLKVFLSSTFRDLGAERAKILVELDKALEDVGMENLIPDGKNSQEAAISKLKGCDIIIFLVSSWYGSILEKCDITDCDEKCMIDNREKLSYTHCEFKVAKNEKKPHQSYIIDKRWELVNKLKKIEKFDWENAWDDPIFKGMSHEEIRHYLEISKRVVEFRSEVEEEFSPIIKEDFDVRDITANLAYKIIEWHSEGRISFREICGRKEQFKDLIDKIAGGVEVYGAGGIGKTTLVQLALLVQKLKGKSIIAIGRKQSYSMGSGYKYFIDKCKKNQYELDGNIITLNSIIDALSLPENIKTKNQEEKIKSMASLIINDNTILFIDDFQIADRDVHSFVKSIGSNVIIASKKKVGIMRNELYIPGISLGDRDELINTICKRLNKTISSSARERIKTIAEGHPVSTELLVRNSERINFDKLETYKQGLDLSTLDHIEEFLKRLIEDVLNTKSYELLKNLSILNKNIENNLDIEAIKKTSPDGFNQIMAELCDTGMLRKKENLESAYQFTYRHIEEVLADNEIERHQWAVVYYKNKVGFSREDMIEMLYHQSFVKAGKDIIDNFVELVGKMKRTDKGVTRLVDLGILLNDKVSSSKQKATILRKLGYLCGSLNIMEDCFKYTEEAKAIYAKLLLRDRNNYAYKNELSLIWCYLGITYSAINKHTEAEKAFDTSLSILTKIPTKGRKPHYTTAAIHADKGNLYSNMNRFEDALKEYRKSLEIISNFNKESLRVLIDTQNILICLFTLYIKMGMIEEGVYELKSILNHYKDILPYHLISMCYKSIGLANEKEDNPKEAARNYMYAAANYFIWFQMGANILQATTNLLEKVIEFGDEEAKGEAIFVMIGINKLMGRNVDIPQDVCITTRIEPLKEALNGTRKNFLPKNEIELMIKKLSDELLSR